MTALKGVQDEGKVPWDVSVCCNSSTEDEDSALSTVHPQHRPALCSHANPQQKKKQQVEVKGSNADVSLGCGSSQWARVRSAKDLEQCQP
eukprot:2246830-Rhodomonas_salina.1